MDGFMSSETTVEIGLATFVDGAEVLLQRSDTTGLKFSFSYKARRRTPMHHIMALVTDHIYSQKFRHGLAVQIFPDLMSMELFRVRCRCQCDGGQPLALDESGRHAGCNDALEYVAKHVALPKSM